jgi:mxaJ protein
MSLRCPEIAALAVAAACAVVTGVGRGEAADLRVCADADNLPYSHKNGAGFENRIAALVAQELGANVTYTWFPQRRGFVRNTLNARTCDVVIGVPTAFEQVRTTAPYYRSSYVFVYRKDGVAGYRSFDEPALRTARIGIQLIGSDLATTPPGHALARRGITDNVVGFTIDGEVPQAQRMIEAVAARELDVALVWGPQAAYFARRAPVPLELARAEAPSELAELPFEFPISMGVRKSDAALQQALDEIIARRRSDIDAILAEFNVPRADAPGSVRSR